MEIENERDFPLADERGKAGEGEKKKFAPLEKFIGIYFFK